MDKDMSLDKLDVQDLIDEIRFYGGEVDESGYVTLYHNTSKESAEAIRKTGKMIAKEDGIFFSTNPDGYASGYGSVSLKFKIPAHKLELDDVFDGEAHLRMPLKNRKQAVDVREYLQPED